MIARAGLHKPSCFSQRDLTGAYHKHRTILQVEKDRVVFHPKCSVGQAGSLRPIGNRPAELARPNSVTSPLIYCTVIE